MRSKKGKHADIIAKFYVPATRIFCMSLNIPFHLTFESNAVALAAFLPYSPSQTNGKKQTKLELLRQTTVDVKNEMHYHVKTDMWRVDCIGEGTFKHAVRLIRSYSPTLGSWLGFYYRETVLQLCLSLGRLH